MIKKVPIMVMLVVLFIFTNIISVNAQEIKEMKATAYCLQGQTAIGTQARYGICAGKKEWVGKQVIVFTKANNLYLGTYIIEDTGGATIKNGDVLDLWFPTKDLCDRFGCVDIIAIIGD